MGASSSGLGRLAENSAGPWFKLSVFGKLGLNNAGWRAVRENCKVLCQPFHLLPRPVVWLNIRLQVDAKIARAAHRAHQKVAKKQAWPENDPPTTNLSSILSPACVTIQPLTPLSSGAASRGLPASLAPSSAASVVSLSASMILGALAASS